MGYLKRGFVVFIAITFMLYYGMGDVIKISLAQKNDKVKNYIVRTKTMGELNRIEKNFNETDEINNNSKELAKEHKIISVKMTEAEAEQLEQSENVSFLEENVNVEASVKKQHEKKEKKLKTNTSKYEWNQRTIKTDKILKKKIQEKDKITIAIIDSGVDWGNDINLKKSITLVPGEEEMSPLFMDGSGHGNSVAGLIAALDNKEGITGINPDAQIISIRVLDDDNIAPLSRVIEAIYLAIEEKVNIINMSFGTNRYSEVLHKAIKDATDAGILVIAAAGNKGEEGVEYPAAYKEVMAVGAVDKEGEIVRNSAKGSEVEITAPGELVRSTGVLGDELISSGTSLAAPQIAAVASLIWEKDISMPADFVRALLNESANAYGEETSYGNGLVDAEYALERYEQFKKNYKENKETAVLDENESTIITFEDTGCIKGSWTRNDHESLVPSTYPEIQKGARFPDNDHPIDGVELFKGMGDNPWWHGHSKKNYVRSYIYATYLANFNGNLFNTSSTFSYPDGGTAMNEDVKAINWTWSDVFGKDKVTTDKKRAFLWGMAIHTLSDVFAHSVYVYDKGWIYLDHTKNDFADKPKQYAQRFNDARTAVNASLAKYNGRDNISRYINGTVNEFNSVMNQNIYYLKKIKTYITDVAGSSVGSQFAKVSYNDPVSTK